MPVFLLIILLIATSAQSVSTHSAAVLGSWEGESKCTVPDSPCHDEHALYHLTADKKDSAKISIEAFKVVKGTPESMGTFICDYAAAESKLTCTANIQTQNQWDFVVSGDTMTGTLHIGPEKTLYRRISLHRSQATEH
jgi:hypothetical protein